MHGKMSVFRNENETVKNIYFSNYYIPQEKKKLHKINYCLDRDFIFLFDTFLEWRMLNWPIDLRSEISFI